MTPGSKLRTIKWVHTVIWAVFAGCILAIPWFAWKREFTVAFALIGIVTIEVIVLLVNRMRCPLTNLAARHTDDRRDNFDIHLPLWLAKYNKHIFGSLFALGVAGTQIAAFGYYGDGIFARQGTWPFSSYRLTMPEQELRAGDSERYEIRGWRSHRTTSLHLALRSSAPVVFAELPLSLQVSIAKPGGKTLFVVESDVFAHLRRMQRMGSTQSPLPTEWHCQHDWGDEKVNRRAVPFVPGASPVAQQELQCWIGLSLPDRDYDLDVRVGNARLDRELTASFELRSGWK